MACSTIGRPIAWSTIWIFGSPVRAGQLSTIHTSSIATIRRHRRRPGNNSHDNVEQVCLLTPGERGLYEVRVYSPNTWQSDEQYYSLISNHPLSQEHPPKPEDQTILTPACCPTPITLHAEDDGLPNPPGTLTYAIASLPDHGVLETLDGDLIAEPTALANQVDQVVYRADAGFVGDDRFTFCADDGGTSPSGGLSAIATVTLTVRDVGMGHYQISALATMPMATRTFSSPRRKRSGSDETVRACGSRMWRSLRAARSSAPIWNSTRNMSETSTQPSGPRRPVTRSISRGTIPPCGSAPGPVWRYTGIGRVPSLRWYGVQAPTSGRSFKKSSTDPIGRRVML